MITRELKSITVDGVTVEYEVTRGFTEWKSETFVPAPGIVHVAEAEIPGIGSCRATIQVGENR